MPCQAATRTYYKAITPKTIGWLLADLKAIGYDRPGLEYLDPEAPGAADLFGREIDVVCEHETYEGQTRERWSIHRERTREKIGREGLARLDAQYGDQIRRVLGAGDDGRRPAAGDRDQRRHPLLTRGDHPREDPRQAGELLSELRKRGEVRWTGSEWRTRCPAHDDHGPSLYVQYMPETSNTLVRCSAGCDAESVVAALGLDDGRPLP